MFRPEAIEEFEAILCRAIEDSFTAAQEQIKVHREGRGAGDVFRELQQIFGDVFICAGYLLGHVHGVERNLKDRTPRLDEIFQNNPASRDSYNAPRTRPSRSLAAGVRLGIHRSIWAHLRSDLRNDGPMRTRLCETRRGMAGRHVRGAGSAGRGPKGIRTLDQVLRATSQLNALSRS